MAEGLSATEVGKEISEHVEHSRRSEGSPKDRIVSILEACCSRSLPCSPPGPATHPPSGAPSRG